MSVISTWMAEATTVLEALTPNDRTQYTFREVDGRREPSGHRQFRWSQPQRGPVSMMNASVSYVDWTVDLKVLIKAFGRGGPEEAAALADDTNQIARAFEARTQGGNWTTTNRGVLMDDFVDLEDLDNGDTMATFTFQVQTAETYS